MLAFTLVLFTIFIIFQLLYIFFPLLFAKPGKGFEKLEEEKGFSIIIPAFNEQKIILDCIKGMVNLQYQNYEAIFVNDGSTDETLELLTSHLQLEPTKRKLPAIKIPHQRVNEVYRSKLFPKIFVIDKHNGGKADSLNAGTEYSVKKFIVTLDADSVLDPKALQALNSAFEDERVLAAGGMVQIGQGFEGNYLKPTPTFKKSGIIKYQVLQYLTSFYLHKLTQTKMKSIIVIAGAFGAFRKEALLAVDGYRKTVGEDMDITLRLHQLIKTTKKYQHMKLIFVPYALCYTECPESFKDLYNQRIRWQKAFIDCVLYYKKSFIKKLGVRVSTFFLLESLLLGTINAFFLILIPIMFLFNQDHYMIAVALFTITVLLSSYQSIATVIVSNRYGITYSLSNYIKIALFIPFEVITYRLLGILFVINGTVGYFKNKDSWYVSKRIGTNSSFVDDKTYEHNQAV
ncbi:cellulose synthase/poly-beta-1,6-N-acetylglucosamine synthase-like glycosyltransferase [Salirhabdus euzebyi]|uniref:Cellulose synthase/poly-beta-1,6-N-acetylglucosamine synthase-like glycosyltransferase n=1 Tax=Salirhabdus euzebyi TaxID=394506 RepID=A0A841PWM4_9BACI|nr:glycosyltransferase family 2 protein [Salirhabdus euzebyi]MBB6451736.1 cellulose synthase/poly-beta-1,6-N-acetylglucosamine synthase-like glycosyltransferase [Salirhabdus euzebyi]